MAEFGGARFGAFGEAARGWHSRRLLLLYGTGLAAGLGLGTGLSAAVDGGLQEAGATREPVSAAVFEEAPAPTPRPLDLSALELPIRWSFERPAQAQPDLTRVMLPDIVREVPVAVVAPAQPSPQAPPPAATGSSPAAAVQQPQPSAAPPAQAAPAPPAPAPAEETPPEPAPDEPAEAPGRANFYLPTVSSGGMSGMEGQLLAGINAEREAAGLPAYAFDATLTVVARTRSQQMADQGYFGHVDPHGYSMYVELLAHHGIGYAWAGENLAMNNYAAGEASVRAMITLMKSPSHRANILADDFTRIGVGEVTTGDGRHIFTMIFIV